MNRWNFVHCSQDKYAICLSIMGLMQHNFISFADEIVGGKNTRYWLYGHLGRGNFVIVHKVCNLYTGEETWATKCVPYNSFGGLVKTSRHCMLDEAKIQSYLWTSKHHCHALTCQHTKILCHCTWCLWQFSWIHIPLGPHWNCTAVGGTEHWRRTVQTRQFT